MEDTKRVYPVRVLQDHTTKEVHIVQQDHGRVQPGGWLWMPVVLARFPVGVGRTFEEAVAMAQMVADCLDIAHAEESK